MYDSTSPARCLGVSLAALVVVLLLNSSLEAQDRGRGGRRGEDESTATAGRQFDLDSWGQLGRAVKDADGWFELSFYEKDKKGRSKKVKGFIHLSEKTNLLADLRIPVEKMEEGQQALLYGRPVDRQVPGRGGVRGGRDSQVQNCQVIIAGEIDQLTVANRDLVHRKFPDLKWCSVSVTKTGGGLEVSYDNRDSRVTMAKGAPAILRQKLELSKLKGKPYVQVIGKKSEERPATSRSSDAQKPCFEARTVVLLDRRYLKTVYPLLWER